MATTLAVLCPSTQLTASAATYVTAAASLKTVITRGRITNSDASVAYTFTLYRVASGGSATAANILVNARSVPAGGSDLVPELNGMVLNAGDFIQALASTTAKLNFTASGFTSTT